MKKYRLLYKVVLFLFVCTLLSAHYSVAFEYESEKRAKENQQEIDELKARVGNQYRILPNRYIKFYDRPDILSDNFTLTETTVFLLKSGYQILRINAILS